MEARVQALSQNDIRELQATFYIFGIHRLKMHYIKGKCNYDTAVFQLRFI